jgi:hypothetical protein
MESEWLSAGIIGSLSVAFPPRPNCNVLSEMTVFLKQGLATCLFRARQDRENPTWEGLEGKRSTESMERQQ